MRKLPLLFSLVVSVALVMAAQLSPASAKQVKVSQGTVTSVCGSNGQTGGGHYGCTKKCGSSLCDYDCQTTPIYGHMKNCTKTSMLKATGGSKIETGPTRNAGTGTGKPIRHPIDVGVKNPPTNVKTEPVATWQHGGMNQNGGRHR
jgi:hypothetical protein